MNRPIRIACCLLAIGLAAPAVAREPGAHVHGAARLEVAIDGNTLAITLESPLDSLLGFEHAPRTDQERMAVRAMAEHLNRAARLFAPTPAAGCAPVSVKLESPVLAPAGKPAADGHADVDGDYVFRCERPEGLRNLEVKLFDAFPGLRQVDVQVAGPRGQAAARLSPKARRIAW